MTKVALVHDWLYHMRGGEKVLEAIAELYPQATIYTLFYKRDKLSPRLQAMKIRSSFLQFFPGILKYYRWLLPILPWVIQTLSIDQDTELVISSSHCVAKGIRTPPKSKHICYCHTPMRYLWGFEEEYFSKFPKWLRGLIQLLFHALRAWDLKTNRSVDLFIANSNNVRKRIQNFYHRESVVAYPPLDTEAFSHDAVIKKSFYLIVSAFVPYKKLDIVIEAFNTLDRELLIVGSGPLETTYRAMAHSPKIQFLGAVSNEALKKLYSEAKAVLFPTHEDFGIVPLEAQACGTPVIALGQGGALESVKSGIFFKNQTPGDVCEAVSIFEQNCYNPEDIAKKVKCFEKTRFKNQIQSLIHETMKL